MSRVKGWCPGAWRPMESGDGLILRIRPHGGRLSAAQLSAIAELAARYGNGQIDLGSRAHLQLRGVTEPALDALRAALDGLGLLDPDAQHEARRNLLVTPLWHTGDETLALLADIETTLVRASDLPAKFGIALDTGAGAVLGKAPADLRIERAAGGLILRAEGMALGEPVPPGAVAARLAALLAWFADQPGVRRGEYRRMAGLIAAGIIPPLAAGVAPLTAPPPQPGRHDIGWCLALPFGRISAGQLARLAIAPVRLTPWRSVLLEGITTAPEVPGLISDPGDPILRVSACPGAPACTSASVATRDLARALAPRMGTGDSLHVSGCAKGCAHPRPATLTLTGHNGRFDLIRDGRAGDPPALRDLTPETLLQNLRGPFAPPL